MDIWYEQHCNVIVEITHIKKCKLPSKHLFQRTQQHGGLTKPLSNNKFVYENVFQLLHRIKNIRRSKLNQ